MTDPDLWQHLEAEFARVLGEIPKPEGPTPEQRAALDALAQEAQERGEYGEAPKPRGSTLPYDIARCPGRDWPECADCLRRLAPDNPNGWQTYTMPPERRPHPAWVCDSRIVERGDERPTCDNPPAPHA